MTLSYLYDAILLIAASVAGYESEELLLNAGRRTVAYQALSALSFALLATFAIRVLGFSC